MSNVKVLSQLRKQMEAQQAIAALADARRSERAGALYLAERRVEIAENAAVAEAARRELDWTPRTPLAEGLRRTISYAEKELTDKVYTELTWAEMN